MKILIIDDDKGIRELLNDLLIDEKHEVTSMSLAIKALQEITDYSKFEVIICDFNMPIMNGLEYFKIIREKFEIPPFILFSSIITTLSKSSLSKVHASFSKQELEKLICFVSDSNNF